jgi:DNA-binding CsgD family transcriptional regulator
MREVIGKVPPFRAFSGIAAFLVIVWLLVDRGSPLFEPRTLLCTLIASISIMGALLPPRLSRRHSSRLPAVGEGIKLEDFGLSRKEREFVLEFLRGMSMKEISIEHRLSYSTVRNTFSSAYAKLGVSKNTELIALGALYKIAHDGEAQSAYAPEPPRAH